jgi:hypothetical protein
MAAYWAKRGSFLLASHWRIGEFQPTSKVNSANMTSWINWTNEQPTGTLAALAFDYNQEQEQDNILFAAPNGQALYSWRIEGKEPVATSHASLRLFGPGVQAVALTFWPVGRPDSALVLTHTPTGDQLQRIAIRPQLDSAEKAARSKLSSQVVPASASADSSQQASSTPPAVRSTSPQLTQPKPAAGSRIAASLKRANTKKSRGKSQDNPSPTETTTRSTTAEDPNKQVSAKSETGRSSAPSTSTGKDYGSSAPIYQQTRPRPDSLNRQTKKQPARDYKKE